MSDPKFLTGPPIRHVATMSLTASIGLMAIFIVDFVDMIFIAMLGNAALAAAIGYAGTILFFTTSVSIGLAIAAGALTARALGARDAALARERATTVLILGLAVGVAVVVAVWLATPLLLAGLGASGETLDLAAGYLRIIVPSMPLLMGGMVAAAVLRAHGDARRSMMSTVIGGVVNAALDPVLIFGLGMELQGAALASVAARTAILVAAMGPAIRVHNGFARPSAAALRRDIGGALSIAVPAMLTNVATPVGTAIMTRQMAEFGEAAVAGMAIVGRLTPVSFAVIFALSGAIGPIIGQNAGAGLPDRVRRTYLDGLIFTAAYVLLVAVLLFALRGPLAALFEAEGVTRELLFLFCGPLALAFFFNGVIFVGNAAFNNLNHPFYSTWINWGRNTVGTLPLVMLGAWLYGAPGVLIGQAAGGLIFAALSAWLAVRLVAKAPRHEPEAFQHETRRLALSARHR